MPSVFITGPTLPESAPVYVSRAEEQQLFDALESGQSCTLIGPPRLGKTSLALKAKKRLARKGVRVAYINLLTLGRDNAPDAWLDDLCNRLREELDLPPTSEEGGAPAAFDARWSAFLRREVLGASEPCALFLDEVNLLRGRTFAADFFDVLAGVLEGEPRPTLCLISSVTASELVDAAKGNPFGMAKPVVLRDFLPAEVAPWGAHLGVPDPEAWLDAIYAQTEGHPYLTQRMCAAIASGEMPPGDAPGERAKAFVDTLLGLVGRGAAVDPLFEITERLFIDLRSVVIKLDALEIYEKLLHGRVRLRGGQEEAGLALRVLGLASRTPGKGGKWLKLRNKVLGAYFDDEWVRGQRSALHRPYTADIDRWAASAHNEDHLPRGAALAAATDWFDKHQRDLTLAEREYHVALLRRTVGTQRARSGVLAAVAGVVIAAAAMLSLQLRTVSQEKQRLAEIQRRFAAIATNSDQTDLSKRVEAAQAARTLIQAEFEGYEHAPSTDLARELLKRTVSSERELAEVLATVNEARLKGSVDLMRTTADLQTAKTTLATEQEAAKTKLAQSVSERDTCYRKYSQVTSDLSRVTAERDDLQKSLSAVTSERDDARRTAYAVTVERDDAKRSAAALTAERDECGTRLTRLTAERDEIAQKVGNLNNLIADLRRTVAALTAAQNAQPGLVKRDLEKVP